MAIITKAEVKSYLNIHDEYVENESITFSSVCYQKLDYPRANIIYVAKDDDNSSVHTTYLTTNDYYTTEDAGGNFLIRRIDTSTIGDTDTVYVRYTYNEYDTRINDLIPIVERNLVDYLDNYFPDKNTRYTNGNFIFLSSGPYIGDTEQEFVNEGFSSGMDIAIEGTYRNLGIYTIKAAVSSQLTLSSNDTIVDECSTDEYGGNVIRITRIKWPAGIKRTAAKIIWANIHNDKLNNIRSKSLGPSNITYVDLKSGGYTQDIYEELKPYKYVSMK